jgi:hypothetical protein
MSASRICTDQPRSRHATVFLAALLVLALAVSLTALPARRASAATPHPPAPAATQAKPHPAPTRTTAAVAAAASTYAVSKAVYKFLATGLGIPLGGSAKLTGTPSGNTITMTVGKPTALGLPTGVAAPALGSTKIVINTQKNTLTATASATGSAPAKLKVKINHANTSKLPSSDLSAQLSVTSTVLGSAVILAGPLTDVGGQPAVSLTGTFAGADTVKSGVLTLAKGATVTAATTGGVHVSGQATVGSGAAATAVIVAGTVAKARTWRLAVTPPTTATAWTPFDKISLAPKFTGSVADVAGTITFDLTSSVAVNWSPTTNVTVAAKTVEYADTAPPSGAPSITAGGAWIDLAGTITAAAGTGHTLSVTGAAVVDTASGHATLTGTQTGTLQLATSPAVSLSSATVQGTATVTASTITAQVAGTGKVAVGSATPVNATFQMTSGGVFVAHFTSDLSAFGLGAKGTLGEVLYAGAAVASYTVPSTGKTISLSAGFNSADGTTSTPPTPPAPPASGGNISSATEQFLNKLGLGLTSTTLSGKNSNGTITATEPAPTNLPITLPTGDAPITFGATTLTLDTSADTLTASATATAAQGTAATLSVTINHVSQTALSGADLNATLHVTGLKVFGVGVDLDGSLTYSGGKLAASVTGTLPDDVVVSSGILTIDAGTAVGYSTADGLTVSGSVDLGADPAKFTVAFTGTITDLKNWSLSVSDAAGAPTFTPVAGLTFTPNFSGTLSDKDGKIGFDVQGNDITSWSPTDAVTVSVKHVELSNQKPADTLTCPSDLEDGQVWADVSGAVTYAPSGSNLNVSGTVEACVVPTAKKFTLTGDVSGNLLPSTAGFQIDDVTLTVEGDLAAKTFTVTAKAQLTITAVDSAPTFNIGISFSKDGTFVAGVQVPDLDKLGLSGTNGWLLLATKEVKNFKPADLGIHNADGSDITPFDLPAGITVTMAFALNDQEVTALQKIGVPLQGASVQLMATLSTSGFNVKIEVNFGAADQGLRIVDTSSGIKLYLDTLYVDFDLSETSTTLSLGGTAYLQVPSVVPNDPTPSAVEIGVNGSINLDTLTFSIGISLTGACGADSCTWHNAFGIGGLDLDSLSGTIGVDFETAIPTPTISIKVDHLVLPDSWSSSLGVVAGTSFSLALDLNLSQPLVNIDIEPGPGSMVALTPLKIFTSDANTIDSLEINHAHLLFAPLGGTEADGTVVLPGVALDFAATIGGVHAKVAAAVSLDPANPSITADVSVDSFGIGPVNLNNPKLHLAISPLSADFSFSGGFSDSFTGISFNASVDLGVSVTLLHASVALNIQGGLPQYLYAASSLYGSVSADANGFSFSASGSLYLSIGGYYFAAINVSYSTDGQTIWRDLNNDASAVAAAFVNGYNAGVSYIYNALQSLGFGLQQIEQAIASAFAQGAAWVIEQVNAAGVAINDAVQAAINGLDATATQVASALQYVGEGVDQITQQLQADFNAGSATIYNALVSIGAGGESLLASISSLFNNGSYNLWVGDAPDVLDVSGASNAPGGGVIQYGFLLGATNQDWYVLPTDSGYAELVNRNSGQCLTDPNYATGPTNLVQDPCTGESIQQWYLGVYPGQSLTGQTRVPTNRYSGLAIDVTGASFWPGAVVEQYTPNGGSNQNWTFLPAA